MAVRWPKLRPNSPGRAPGPIRLDAALPGPAALRAATEATGRREAALAALPARIAKRWIMPGRRETRVGQRLRHFWAMALPPAPPGARVLGIVLAHFNIDEGSRIELQLPEPVALVEEDVLPDLMLPEGSHHREDDHTTFFVTPVAPECAGGDGISARPRVVCYNVIRAYRDPSVARGLRLYALGVLTTLPSCHILRAPLILALDSYIKHPAPSVLEQAWSVLSQLNRAELPACPPARRRLLRRTVAGGASSMLAAGRVAQEGGAPLRPAAVQDGALHRPEACVHRVNLTWSQSGGDGAAGSAPAGPVVTLRVPLHREPEEVGVLAASDLVTRYGVGVAALYWAVLLEQRVLVVGHREAAASTVCDGVLTAAALVAPPLVGVVARAHPYSCLGSLDFLDQRGFIAGMTNPIFASQPGKWDLCLDAATGTVRGPDNAPCHADTVAAADVALSFIRHHRRRQRTGHTHGADSGPATGVQGAPGPADAPSAGGATRGSEEDAHSVDPGLLHAMTRWDEELMARVRSLPATPSYWAPLLTYRAAAALGDGGRARGGGAVARISRPHPGLCRALTRTPPPLVTRVLALPVVSARCCWTLRARTSRCRRCPRCDPTPRPPASPPRHCAAHKGSAATSPSGNNSGGGKATSPTLSAGRARTRVPPSSLRRQRAGKRSRPLLLLLLQHLHLHLHLRRMSRRRGLERRPERASGSGWLASAPCGSARQHRRRGGG